MAEKYDPDALRFWWQDCESCPGVFIGNVLVSSYPCPVCTIYFTFGPGVEIMHILDVHTNTHFLRKNIASELLRHITSIFDETRWVVSGSGSTKAGKGWMKSLGFKKAKSGVMKGHYVVKVSDMEKRGKI